MPIIGIDLGTTNSAIAYLKDGKPEIIPNKEGHRTTPSVFNISPQGEIQIGRIAKNAYPGSPNETVLEVKRYMGSDKKIKVTDREFAPEEISSFYLKYLKESAEEALGEAVTEAIITVPAYFSDSQRKATQIAGKIAGLNVERVINEPTAAAIAFGIENMDKDSNVLIYDLGGGTFDVSIVEMFSGIVQVKATTGDNNLGGMDFDECLVQWLAKQVKRTQDFDVLNEGSELEIQQRYARIKSESENVKIALSTNQTAQFNLPFIAMKNGMPISIAEEITRDEFNDIIRLLVDKTLTHVDRALEQSNLSISDIDEVLLIGGSTRIPLVQSRVEEKFGKPVRKDINPDEAVALGAAVQGGIKGGEISASEGLMVVDVCPYSLGTDVTRIIGGQQVHGFFDELIPANTPIPATNSKTYSTMSDDQERVQINVYQGDGIDQYVKENLKINKNLIILDGIPKGPAGSQSITITFEYDINGMLNISAEIVSTGKRITSAINAQTGVMSDIEIEIATRNVEESWNASSLYAEVKTVITRAERILPDLQPEDQQKLQSALTGLKTALSNNNEPDVRKYEDILTDLLIELV